jgi:hypothetical protein
LDVPDRVPASVLPASVALNLTNPELFVKVPELE